MIAAAAGGATSNLGVFDPDLYARGDPRQAGLPLRLFAQLRDERPCFWQALTEEPMFIDGVWVVTRHADVLAMIRDTARLSNRAGTSVRRFDPTVAASGGKPTMVSMDGAAHRNNRTVTSKMFSLRATQVFERQFRAIAARLIEHALDKERIDFVRDVACYMPLDAMSDVLGIPAEDRQQILTWTNLIAVPLDPQVTPTRQGFEEALEGLWGYGLKLAERRSTEPDDRVMTAVAKGREAGRLSDDEVCGYMLQLAAAGNETTRNAIAFGLLALLQRPEQMALLRANGISESAIEEILRWSAPTVHTVRVALEDITLHGETIPAGDPVALMLASANFDPAKFDGPELFDVMRAPNEHVAFGSAAHTCLGLHVARLELKVIFEELLQRADSIALDGPIELVRDNLIHGIRAMPVRMARAPRARHTDAAASGVHA